jgi:hypothetical protein
MIDTVYRGFLDDQNRELEALAAASDLLDYQAIQTDPELPPNIFIIGLECAHAVQDNDQVRITRGTCRFGIQLPTDYLRRSYPTTAPILSLIDPAECAHPNVRWPFICAGTVAPGTSVTELILRVDEILTFNRFTPREDDCLNRAACQWARANLDLFPLERRPLRNLADPGGSGEPQIPRSMRAAARSDQGAP